MSPKPIASALVCLLLTFTLSATTVGAASSPRTIRVPEDYSTIQAAIDAASAGDTVLVAPGNYDESIRLKSGVIVQGSGAEVTTISGDGSEIWGLTYTVYGYGVSDSTISGFTITGSVFGILIWHCPSVTITNNTVTGNSWMGIYCSNSTATVTNNTITGNDTGITCYYSSATITNNTVTGNSWLSINCSNSTAAINNNTVRGNRLGISCTSSTAAITQNIITGNDEYGITFQVHSTGVITNNTVTGNGGDGISCGYSSPSITNNIITGNDRYGIRCGSDSSPTISYNDVWGNGKNYHGCLPGPGDIDNDPLFVDPAAGDYHLQVGSPSIDAGTNDAPGLPGTDFDGNPRIVDGDGDGVPVVDMGAFESQVIPDSYEPDDSSSQASTISCGDSQNHSIRPVGDKDWVKFSLSEKKKVTIETSGPSGDTRMWLYDSNLRRLAYDDDGGSRLFSKIVEILNAGTYYVKIDEYGNNDEIASYTISLTCEAIDTTPPTTFDLVSPDDDSWTSDTTPTFSWQASSDPESGLAGYDLYIDDSLDKSVGATTTSTTPSSPLASDGHSWYVVAKNNVGLTTQSTSTFTINIDTTPPTTFDLSSPADDSWVNTKRPTLSWEASSDSGSGLKEYLVYVDDTLRATVTAPTTSWTLNYDLSGGSHTWYVVAVDYVGNTRQSTSTFTVKVDTTPPISSVNLIEPYWQKAPFTVTATTSDDLSGVASVELFYRHSFDNETWSDWTSFDIDDGEPYEWSFDAPAGYGLYEFYSAATDVAGNVEEAPDMADARCGVVISAAIDIDPDTLNLRSKGKWITAYIELPEPYDVKDIKVDTITLNGLPAEWTDIQDGVLMVKFDRQLVQRMVSVGDEVELTVTGEVNGIPFEGSDTIRVIMPGKPEGWVPPGQAKK